MPTLHVENVPEDLYTALRKRAAEKHSSIDAEVIELLRFSVPTEVELSQRRDAFERLLEIRSRPSPGPGPFPSAEEMIREDRNR